MGEWDIIPNNIDFNHIWQNKSWLITNSSIFLLFPVLSRQQWKPRWPLLLKRIVSLDTEVYRSWATCSLHALVWLRGYLRFVSSGTTRGQIAVGCCLHWQTSCWCRVIHPSGREWTVAQESIWNSPLQPMCPFSQLIGVRRLLWDHAETSYHLIYQLPWLPFWVVYDWCFFFNCLKWTPWFICGILDIDKIRQKDGVSARNSLPWRKLKKLNQYDSWPLQEGHIVGVKTVTSLENDLILN